MKSSILALLAITFGSSQVLAKEKFDRWTKMYTEETCWEGESKTSFSINRNEGCFADESARGYLWIPRPKGPTEPLCLVTYADKTCTSECPIAMLQLDRNDGGWCHKFSDPQYGYKWIHSNGGICPSNIEGCDKVDTVSTSKTL